MTTIRRGRTWWWVGLLVAGVACLGGRAGAGPDGDEGEEGDEREEEQQLPRRIKVIGWKVRQVFPDKADDLRKLDVAAVAREIERAVQNAKAGDTEAAKRVFEKYSFAQVEEAAKAKRAVPGEAEAKPLLSPQASEALALQRRGLINEALAAALEKFDPEGRFHVGALDSGNKESGAASDVDQTVFLMSIDGSRPGTSKEVNAFIAAFDAEFRRITGHPPEHYGIESMNGADFYPDWAANHTRGEFVAEGRRVHGEKRKNTEAYQSPGQLKSQAEGRGWQSLQDQILRLELLHRTKSALAEAAQLPEQERSEHRQRLMKDLVQGTLGAGGAGLPLSTEADAAAALARVEAHVAKNSPWTEAVRQADGSVRVTQTASPLGKVLPDKPEFARRFAFDGAWDNLIKYWQHPHNRTKYLIRSVAEGTGVLFRALEIAGAKGNGTVLTPLEYDSVYGKGDQERLTQLVETTYGKLTKPMRERFKRAMDVGARVRLRHKEKEPYKGFTDRQVFAEYVDAVRISEAEAKTYGPVQIEEVRMERAMRAWQADAQEVMIENVLLTADAPADVLRGRLTAAERERLARRGASWEKLRAAVELQFEHMIMDFMSLEHARARALPEGSPARAAADAKRPRDMVDRLLERFRGEADLGARLEKIANETAVVLLRLDVESARDHGLVAGAKAILEGKLKEVGKARERMAAELAKWRAGEPGHTTVDLSRAVVRAAAERHQGRMFEYLHGVGFAMDALKEEGRTTRLEVGKWDVKRAVHGFASAGSLDSAVEVMRAYAEGGDLKAAAKCALLEAGMTLPYVSEGAAFLRLFQEGDPQGVVMLAAGYLVPGTGQAYLAVNLAKNVVWLGGYYAFEPLKDDTADLVYQGFLDAQGTSWGRAGRKALEPGQRFDLLSNVRDLRVVPYVVRDEDGKAVLDKEGREQVQFAFAKLSYDEAFDLGLLEPREGETLAQDFAWLEGLGLLGGGEEYEKRLAEVRDAGAHQKANFEARRSSLFYAYEKRVRAVLEKAGVDVSDAAAAHPLLTTVFGKTLHDWLHGSGEFANVVDGETNELILRKVEPLRERIAGRMASDYLRSHELVRGGSFSFENGVRANVKRARDEREARETNQLLASHLASREEGGEPMEAEALSLVLAERRLEDRVPAAHVRVRPAVVPGREEDGREVDTLECRVSVVADPRAHPPIAGGAYAYDATWETIERAGDVVLKARVAIRDAAGSLVGRVYESEIATVEPTETGPFTVKGRRLEKARANGLVVSGDVLKLDPQQKNGVVFLLYRSQDPEGPFEEVMSIGGYAFAGDPVLEDPEDGGWLDRARFQVVDLGLPTDLSIPSRPFRYQVGSRPARETESGFTAEGEEVRSKATVPGPGIVFVDALPSVPSGNPDEILVRSPIEASLALEDQMFDVPGAHLTAQGSGWTVHAFAPRRVGDTTYGSPSAWNVARATLGIPFLPEGGTVTLRGEGDGWSAVRTVQMVEDPEQREANRQARAALVAQGKQQAEARAAARAERKASAAEWLSKREAQLAALPPATSLGSAKARQEAEMNVLYARTDLRRVTEETAEREEGQAALDLARALGDGPAYLAGARRLEAASKVAYAFDAERIRAMAASDRALLAYLEAAEAAERGPKIEEELAAAMAQADGFRLTWRFGDQQRIAEGAWMACDLATYRAAVEAILACLVEAKEKGQSLNGSRSGWLASLAEGVVRLSGDRQAAKTLLLASRAAALEDALSADLRADLERHFSRESLPAWWP